MATLKSTTIYGDLRVSGSITTSGKATVPIIEYDVDQNGDPMYGTSLEDNAYPISDLTFSSTSDGNVKILWIWPNWYSL